VPSYGLLPSTFALAFLRPALFAGLSRLAAGGSGGLEHLAEAMFAQPMPPGRPAEVYHRMRRESRRAIMEMSGFGLPQHWREAAGAIDGWLEARGL